MDGPTATRAIRLLGYTGRIFGVTGNRNVQLFLDSGVERVILKPFSIPEFQAALVSRPVGPDFPSTEHTLRSLNHTPTPSHSHSHNHLTASEYARTVLVVEDNRTNRNMLVKLLTSVGQAVEEAVNGQDAVDKVKHRMALQLPPYDAILMDFVMVSRKGF